MTMYQCEICGNVYREPWCDKDQRELKRTVDAPADPVAAAIERQSAGLAGGSENTLPAVPVTPSPSASLRTGSERGAWAGGEAQRVPTHPGPSLDARDDSGVVPPVARAQREITGLAEFRSILAQGFQAVVICGGGGTGESQIVNAFTKANTVYRGSAQFEMQRATLRTANALGATLAGEVWYQVASDRHVFLDPSGEFFRQISLEERQKLQLPDITEQHFDFVRDAVQKLAGIVLVVDLTDRAAWRPQENDFTFVLPALRWLRYDNVRSADVGMSINIASRVQKLPKLDVPVLVLFSKADRLDTITNQQPLAFARRNLPTLHGALVTHAKRLRFDFCHTMIRRGDGDTMADRPCGVLLSLEWLLDSRFRRLPRVPTTWLGGGKR
jgi:GTP-binding protein EngB required for normal cell division